MKKKYYKVVDSGLLSAKHSWHWHPVLYKVGEFVKPLHIGTKLFVFDDLNAAIQWRNEAVGGCNGKVFECEVKNPSKIGNYTSYAPNIDNLIARWVGAVKKHRKRPRTSCLHTFNLPPNTVFVSEVKLTKEVA